MTAADEVIEFIETYVRVPEGRAVGQPMCLMDWQKEWLRAVFDNPHGTRRAILSVGRKNAKSTLVAALLLAYIVGPRAMQNAQVYSAAQSREQAALVFALMAKMVRLAPDLAAHVVIRDSAREMLCTLTATKFRALSADATTAMGTSPLAFVYDEAGQVRGPFCPLFEALHSGQGAHAEPIEFVISTQAASDGDFLSMMIDDARAGNDSRTVCTVYEAPADCDLLDESAWKAANPSLGVILDADYLRGLAKEAKRMHSREHSFRNLVLNQRVETSTPFVSRGVWDENALTPSLLDGASVFGGLDLAMKRDLCGYALVAEDGSVHIFAFTPQEGLEEKSRLDRFDYVEAVREEHLIAVPGRVVDFDFVAQHMRGIFDRCDVQAMACDPAFMNHFRPALARAGFTDDELARFRDFRQGFISMGPAVAALEERLLNRKLRHGNQPILRMCAANAVVLTDDAGNRKFTKKKSTGRIDLLVALTMACAVLPADEPYSEPQLFIFD